MKIGIDGTPFQGKTTGIGRYLYSFLAPLINNNPSYQFYLYGNKKMQFDIQANNLHIIQCNNILRYLKSILWLKFFLHSKLKKDKIDIFIAGNSFLPYFLPKNLKTAFFIHDLNYLLVPQTMKRSALLIYKLSFKSDVSNATILIANSNATALKVDQFFKKKVDFVVHPDIGINFKEFKATDMELPDGIKQFHPYILTVGTFEPRKNLDSAIKAFIKLKEEGSLPNYTLVMIGKEGWKNKELKKIINTRNDLKQLGYINNEILPYIYSEAKAFMYLSIYEGFGIPVREALSVGTNVVASNIDEIKEAGGIYPFYVTATNIDEISTALLQAIQTQETVERKKIGFTSEVSKNVQQLFWHKLKLADNTN
jgi:glycosyltransferase involved in cell wall biosynthesis